MAKSKKEKVIPESGTSYCKMPDGTLMCWGVTKMPSDGTLKISFPKAFVVSGGLSYSFTCSWFSVNGNVSGEIGTQKTFNKAADSIYVTIAGSMPTAFVDRLYVSWVAIGRWK
jgi:hypothetical protein